MAGGAGALGFALFAPAVLGFVAIVLSSNGWTIEDFQPITFMKTVLSSNHCGLLRENEFVITSRRVVFPDGMGPAAGKFLIKWPRSTAKNVRMTDLTPYNRAHIVTRLITHRSRLCTEGHPCLNMLS
jgi:hypothetical protein